MGLELTNDNVAWYMWYSHRFVHFVYVVQFPSSGNFPDVPSVLDL